MMAKYLISLKNIREAKGFAKQEDLAEAIGVNQATVQRMEAAAESVTLRRYIQAAEVLGVTLAEIFADDRSEAEVVLVRHWRSLPASERAIWAEHLRLASRSSEGSPGTDPGSEPKAPE